MRSPTIAVYRVPKNTENAGVRYPCITGGTWRLEPPYAPRVAWAMALLDAATPDREHFGDYLNRESYIPGVGALSFSEHFDPKKQAFERVYRLDATMLDADSLLDVTESVYERY